MFCVLEYEVFSKLFEPSSGKLVTSYPAGLCKSCLRTPLNVRYSRFCPIPVSGYVSLFLFISSFSRLSFRIPFTLVLNWYVCFVLYLNSEWSWYVVFRRNHFEIRVIICSVRVWTVVSIKLVLSVKHTFFIILLLMYYSGDMFRLSTRAVFFSTSDGL